MSGKVVGWIGTYGPHPDHLDRTGVRYGARARGLRMVLLAVGDASNPDGNHAHPGIENVADFSLYSKRQAINLLQELEAEGWIKVEERGGGLGRATTYTVNLTVRAKGEVIAQNGAENCAMGVSETVQPEPASVQSGVHSNGNQRLVSNENPLSPDGDPVVAVFDAWRESTGHTGATLTDGRRRKITNWLKAYPVTDLIDAVRGVRWSPFHLGDNDRKTVYDGIETILRDAQQIERFRDYERGINRPRPGLVRRPASDVVNAAAAKVAARRESGHGGLFALPKAN